METLGTIDDLVLHLKGLVLVRQLRESRGAEEGELQMYGAEIERVCAQIRGLTPAGSNP